MLGINRSKFKAGVSPVLSCEGSFDRAARSFTSFRTSFGPGTLNLELWYGWLRVNALQKPVGGNLVTGALFLRFGVDCCADSGKLQSDSKIVQKASRLFRRRPPRDFPRTQPPQLRSTQQKRMSDRESVAFPGPLLIIS